MKYIIGFVVLLAIFLTLFFSYQKERRVSITKTETETTESQNASPVIVSSIKTLVYLHTSGAKTEVNEPVLGYEGDKVETNSTGRALLQMENGTLTSVDYSTKIDIKTHSDDEHSSFFLTLGKVWSTVEKVFGKGEYYEIETQNAVAVVRGTSFGVSFDGEFTTLEVTKGEVLFVPVDKNGKRLYENAVLVKAGEKAVVGNDGVIKVSPLSERDKAGEWFIFNNGSSSTNGSANTLQVPDVRISDLLIRPR